MKNFILLVEDGDDVLVNVNQITKVDFTKEGPKIFLSDGNFVTPDCSNLELNDLIQKIIQ